MSWTEHPSKPRDRRGWERLRRATLYRDNYQCGLRYKGCTHEATEVDHILNVARGGSNSPENLMAVCPPCHKVKTQREAAERRGQYRRKPKPPLGKK